MSSELKRPEFATNVPHGGETVAKAVNDLLRFSAPFEANGRSVAIASAYFNVGGWSLVANELKRAGKVRLLLGAEPQRKTNPVELRPGTVALQQAPQLALAEALEEHIGSLATERDLVPFNREGRSQVEQLIEWLRAGKVEVRRYTREFLHGKAYLIDNPALGVLAGSSNFTLAGLSKNRELNLGQYSPAVVNDVKAWFNGLWDDAEAFDLAEFYEQQVMPDEPWFVFLRMLWEAYGIEMSEDDKALAADPSMRDLLSFQKDGVGRARRILERYNGVLIADEVGLGKTYVGGALIKDTVRARQRVLIVAPKIIRDSVWKPYVDLEKLGGWVDTISYDDLLAVPTPDGKLWRLDFPRKPDEYSMIVLDEAHTVRNTDTLRAEQLLNITKGNPRKKVVLLTATPVNNALADLHSLLSYFLHHDDEFAEIGIPSLAAHFRNLDRMDIDDLAPEHLFDILDAVAVRRTRQFIRSHYVGEKIGDNLTLTFPEPIVRRIDYKLAPELTAFLDTFAHALGADVDPEGVDPFFGGDVTDGGLCAQDSERLTLAGYTPSRYLLPGADVDRRQRAAEVTVAGLLRSGLLKRFESSSAAFCSTARKMAGTLQSLVDLIRNEGEVASGPSLRDWAKLDAEDDDAVEWWLDNAEHLDAANFNIEALVIDVENDIRILLGMANTVSTAMQGASDPKLLAMRETLLKIVAEAERDAQKRLGSALGLTPEERAIRDRDDRKVLVFSYFADTVYYLQEHLDFILDDPLLAPYKDRVAFVSGDTKRPGNVSQSEAVAGFAPRTGGPKDSNGVPTGKDLYDLVFTTDVLSEGVNLQQARNIINADLPWNPQRLVQRHGRLERIGSQHDHVYLWCVFPATELDKLLKLEITLQRKLVKAAKSIGAGKVLPGVAASEDRVFNAKNEQILAIAAGDASIFLGGSASLISGEEFRAILRRAIDNASLSARLAAMPWGVGSGFVTDDRNPGFVFCARILDRADEPAFRFIPLPGYLVPGSEVEAPEPDEVPEIFDPTTRVDVHGHSVEIISDSLTSLTMANPPDQGTPASLPAEWMDLAFDAWAAAQQHIVDTWNSGLDAGAAAEHLAPAIKQAYQHLLNNHSHRNQADVDRAVKVFRRGQSNRVVGIIRAVLRDEGMTDAGKTDRLIELVDELGLTVPEAREKRYPITAEDVHLLAWMGIQPA